ncbi:tail fiber assembly protein [Pseudomonas sp. WJP1]|nr:tail fiber assembly protein [Pseudomonas sp. WJP1]WCM53511.1 tail fiber assembly protein [Pseudomonas sp. WJP1]
MSAEINKISNSELFERIAGASQIIQTLQHSFDIGEISEEETRKLMLWKRYRIALVNTLDQFGWPATPDWPTPPEP